MDASLRKLAIFTLPLALVRARVSIATLIKKRISDIIRYKRKERRSE
jgi:hypothetical protein